MTKHDFGDMEMEQVSTKKNEPKKKQKGHNLNGFKANGKVPLPEVHDEKKEENEQVLQDENGNEMDDLVDNQETTDNIVHELGEAKRDLEKQLEGVKAQNEDLEDDLEVTKAAKLRLEADMQALRAQYEQELQSVEEQAEEKRRALMKNLRDLETELEEERKKRSTVSCEKKFDFETEPVFAKKEDALKQAKKLQAQMKDVMRDAEEEQAAKEAFSTLCKKTERKLKALESEFIQLTEDLADSLMIDEKCRLEETISALEEEIEEKQSTLEVMEDVVSKAQMNNEQLSTELAAEKLNSQQMENARALLERQNKELKAKLAEVETIQRTKLKEQMSVLEAKIASLEEQLEYESKERLLQQKNNRKLEKKIKELSMNIEDERRHGDQHKEQAEKLANRNKMLERHLDEAEEEIQKEKTKMRKAQRDMEDMLEAQEALHRELNTLKSKLRRGGHSSSSFTLIGNHTPKRDSDGSSLRRESIDGEQKLE